MKKIVGYEPDWRFWRYVRIQEGCWEWMGGKNEKGYGRFNLTSPQRRLIRAHRFAYESLVGPIPKGKVPDHTCGNKGCCNPYHIRLATNTQNVRNQGLHKNNTSGYKGIYWHKTNKKWVAHIMVDRKSIYLGSFYSSEEAHEVYCKAAKKYHGEFANFGEK